jgi:hypothetical protein
MSHKNNIVLIIGSAPDALSSRAWSKSLFTHVVAINNAWRVRDDWDFLVHPEDFPLENMPNLLSAKQSIITAEQYVGIQNDFGGFVYAGGTMAYTAAYWALGHLRPSMLVFIGCDMIYDSTDKVSHFYGVGKADPLRDDVTLQSLEAKSARLLYHAHQKNCLCFNLSQREESRLLFPRISIQQLSECADIGVEFTPNMNRFDLAQINQALRLEFELAYYFQSGRYWEHLKDISAKQCLAVDNLWLSGLISTTPICTQAINPEIDLAMG